MTIHTVAAEIARRIPEMAKDSPMNNTEVIERMLKELLQQHELLQRQRPENMPVAGKAD